MTAERFAINIDDIRLAADRLKGVAVVTPLLESPFLNEIAGRRVLVKAECLQRTGSFKFRGAWNALNALDDISRSSGVIAYSSGNHAQGVAHAAAILKVDAVIVMPADAPRAKLDNTRALGAEVITYDRIGGECRESKTESLALKRGLTLIRPYDDPAVIAGQGTCGIEIAQQSSAAGVEQADVLVCCGGGGLSAGIAVALQAESIGLQLRPVEPESADDTCRSLVAGKRVANESTPDTLCDAIITPIPGKLTFPILQQFAGPGISVDDEAVLAAMALALTRLKLVVEPGGAVALAAALNDQSIQGDAVVCVVTGGNVDNHLLARVISRN